MRYLDQTYNSDFIRWLKKRQDLDLDFKHPTSKLNLLQEEIIKDIDAAFACFFAIDFPSFKPHHMQRVVFDAQNPKYAVLFAQTVKNADTKAFQKLVIKSQQLKYVVKFAQSVSNADLPLLEKIIIKSKDPKYAYVWIRQIKNANITKFKKIILSSQNPQYLFELAKHLHKRRDIAIIEDILIKLQSFDYIRLLASKIKLANVEKLEQAILDTENLKEIKNFAKTVKKSKMKKFLLV